MTTKRRCGLAAALLSLMALAPVIAASAAEVGAGAQYVAMGSSFAAGPGVAERAVGAPPLLRPLLQQLRAPVRRETPPDAG